MPITFRATFLATGGRLRGETEICGKERIACRLNRGTCGPPPLTPSVTSSSRINLYTSSLGVHFKIPHNFLPYFLHHINVTIIIQSAMADTENSQQNNNIVLEWDIIKWTNNCGPIVHLYKQIYSSLFSEFYYFSWNVG